MAGLQPNIYAAVFATMPAALVALVLRLVARRIIRMKYWYDDLFAIVGYVFALAYCIDVVVWTTNYSLGQIIAEPGDSAADRIRETSRLLLWLEELFYTASLGFSKFSILTFYWRIFQHTSIRIPIQILLVTVVLWVLTKGGLSIFQCNPVRYAWDKSIRGQCPINVSALFFSTIICHCLMDIIILLLPVFPVAKMHLTLSKKLAVTTIFHSGVIVCVASVFVLVESWKYDQQTVQLPHDSALFSLWAAVEVNMAVFAGSLPMLKPIFRKVFPAVPGMSTEAGSSQHERQVTPPHMWRLGRSNKKKNNVDLVTSPDPVHLEHAIPRPSLGHGRDLNLELWNPELWEDEDSSAANVRSP